MPEVFYSKNFKEEVEETMSLKGIDIIRLSEITNIPEYYLNALVNHDAKNLPSPPYIRGYILKIAEALSLNGEALWHSYKQVIVAKTSGGEDRLPSNRFALKQVSKTKIAIGIIALFAIIYLGWRAGGFFGTPSIDIKNPPTDNFIIREPIIILTGKINPQDKLLIQGEETPVDGNGYFEKRFTLDANGLRSIEFRVKRLLGKEIVITRQVVYQQ